MADLALLTGFPGFIGRRLARQLLEEDNKQRVAALVEERMLPAAREVAERLGPDRIELIPGDIGERHLGLSDDDYERLRSKVDRVFHLAAIYNLSVPLDIARRVNVDGTGNVLDFCRETERLERLAYVSTAYVAGMRTGVVYEHELVMGQEFKNHYESTKFQAEVWVRELMDKVPTTILRPAIVVGDSQTGETEKFDGPYYILRVISRAQKAGQPTMQFGASNAPFNVVPVDYVVAAMATAARLPETLGETLHLVDPEPLTSRQLVELLSNEYAGRPRGGRMPPKLAEASLRMKSVQKALAGTPAESIVYLNHSVVYDTRRARELLGPHGLRPPNFPDYVGAMVRFFREHEDEPAYEPK